MKFKIDENLPIEAATILAESGFDVETIGNERMSGADDRIVAALCQSESRIRVTLDLDFSNIQVYPPDQYAGIIVLRLKSQDKLSVLTSLRRTAAALEKRRPAGELWIVQNDRVRIRQVG